MGEEYARHFSIHPRALALAAGIVLVVGMLPGLPLLPFAFLGAALGFSAYSAHQAKLQAAQLAAQETEPELPRGPESVEALLPLDALELEVGYGLIPLVDEEQQGDLLERIRLMRRQFAVEMGLVVPPLHVRDNLQLKPGEYTICIKGNEVAGGELIPDHYLAMVPGEVKREIEGIPTVEPAFQLPALWIPEEKKDENSGKSAG